MQVQVYHVYCIHANFSLHFSCFLYTFVMNYSILDPHKTHSESFWQSSTWFNILSRSGQISDIFFFWSSSETWMLIEIRSIGLGQLGAFALGVSSSQIHADFPDFLDSLISHLRDKQVLFLQIEPIEEITPLQDTKPTECYKKFLTPHTRIIHLDRSLDEILIGMHEKGRYNIRLAEKRWVSIQKVDATKENIDIWMRLLMETTTRDGFFQNSRSYYETFVTELQDAQSGWLYFAFFEGKVIAAGIFVFFLNSAIYYYWASSTDREMRKHMAPYLLQWNAIKEAKSRGLALFDFLWVADPENQHDPLQWVTEFKEKFGWERRELPKKHMFILSWKYQGLNLLRKIASMLRNR